MNTKTLHVAALMATLCCSCAQQIATVKDSISIAVPYDLSGLDPHALDTIGSIAIAAHFYEGLVKVDGNLKVQAGLADSWESPDSNTWIFHLRPGVKFHNGKKLTPADVVYSFKRVLQDPSLEMSVYVRGITDVVERDAHSVEIKTSRPSSIFLNKIRLIAIVPSGTRPDDLRVKEFGTGPYKLQDWRTGEHIRMLRNDEYWGQKPFLREADFHLKQSPEDAIDSFRSGECRFIQCNSKKLDTLAGAEHATVLRSDSLFVEYLGFNLSQVKGMENPFRKQALRQAIHLALDRGKLVSALSSYAIPAAEPVPVFVFGYNPEIHLPQKNTARLAQLLREAGWTPQSSATLDVRETYREAGTLVQQQLRDAGISLQLNVWTDDQFFDRQRKGQVLSYVSRYGCTTGDASDLVEDVFYSPDRVGLLTGVDPSRYSHPPTTGSDPEKEILNVTEHRRRGLQAVISMFMNDMLMVPLYEDQDAYVIDDSYSWRPRYDSVILASEVRSANTSAD